MFISIDGPDGTGKTTVAKRLVDRLNDVKGDGIAIYTAEPTGSALGKEIRRILKAGDPSETPMLTDYFVQDRAEHIGELEELLSAGHIIVCDRYKYSTVVYQQLQGEPLNRLIALNRDFLKPAYAFILNVENVDTLLAHITGRGTGRDLFEARETLTRVIELYNNMDKYFPDENICFIDAERDIDAVITDIFNKLGCGMSPEAP